MSGLSIAVGVAPPPIATGRYGCQMGGARMLSFSTHRSKGWFQKLKVPSFSSSKTAVSATDSPTITSTDQEKKPTKYYFVVANAKFMLDEEEHFQELLFERLRLFKERNKEQDFWLVVEPKFLDNFPSITKRLGRPAVALVSTNRSWITYMKLRLDRVLSESFEADNQEEALASNSVTLEFKKTEWTAPYPKYESGWWEALLPPRLAGSEV